MESAREPHHHNYHKSDNLKRQALQECGRVSGRVHGDSEPAVRNAETFARLSLRNSPVAEIDARPLRNVRIARQV